MVDNSIPTVLVTGATGFVALEVVKQLLEKGYNVRGSVRSISNKEKTADLQNLGQALPGTLELYEADLLKEGSFDKAVEGVDYVIHMASPFLNADENTDPYKDLIEPAVQGTKNILGSVAKNKSTVKRVVLTSSFAAMLNLKNGAANGIYTEKDWNKDSGDDKEGAYMHSKTRAEQTAWEVAKKEGLSLVAINPSLVLGPVLSGRADGVSKGIVTSFLEGKSGSFFPWVCDVRDVGRAHVAGIEAPDVVGQRFIISQANLYTTKFFTDALKERFPDFKIQDGDGGDTSKAIDNSKALDVLGLGKLHDPKETIIDMANTLIQKGIAKPQKK